MEQPAKKKKAAKTELPVVSRITSTSYFDDYQEYSSDIITSILEEVDHIRVVGNKLATDCYKIQISINDLEKSLVGLTDQILITKTNKKIEDLNSNLEKRNTILNDYNSLNDDDLSLFVTDNLIGNNVVDINKDVKNRIESVRRYTESVISNANRARLHVDIPSIKKFRKTPQILHKSKIPNPRNENQVGEINSLVKTFIEKQNSHKDRLSKAFELAMSDSKKTNS